MAGLVVFDGREKGAEFGSEPVVDNPATHQVMVLDEDEDDHRLRREL